MNKYGAYTWYVKDWRSSRRVFRLSLEERGFYRELIDRAYEFENRVIIEEDLWAREFSCRQKKIHEMIVKLSEMFDENGVPMLIIEGNILSIPACTPRLNLIIGGRNGGKKRSQNTDNQTSDVKRLDKGLIEKIKAPPQALDEAYPKALPQANTYNGFNTNNNNDVVISGGLKNTPSPTPENGFYQTIEFLKNECAVDGIFSEHICRQTGIKKLEVEGWLNQFNEHLNFSSETVKTRQDYRIHFLNWITKKLKQTQNATTNGKSKSVFGPLSAWAVE